MKPYEPENRDKTRAKKMEGNKKPNKKKEKRQSNIKKAKRGK
jgi:hypothetical protein